ncbi:MAG TPA: HlyD family type I secretion periplasmic adaptor subunit [Pseudolabrys sp.]
MTAGTALTSGHALRSARRHALAGAVVLVVLVGGLGGWAAATHIAGAVIASGVVAVDTDVKKVQHPTGGVVGDLRVRDGDAVKAGQVVVRLDDTVTRANLAIVVKSLDELVAREARLEAERDGADKPMFPQSLIARADEPEIARLMTGELRLFELRKSARQGQKDQLHEQVAQLREQIQGLLGQAESKMREIALVHTERDSVQDLWTKNLVPLSRITSLEREAARLDGESNQLVASVAEAKGKISETELKIIQIDQDLRSDVAKELREIQGKMAELGERKITAEDQLTHIDIRAPQDGFVHELSVHTIGGVISPGEQIMLIVPDHDDLTVQAKVDPRDINQLYLGQSATLKFPAFDARTTPDINGAVATISADTTQDENTGASFYQIRIRLPPEEVARLDKNRLVPGMPVEVFVQTSPRTAMSYFVKPLRDQIAKAFREK